MSNWWKRSTIGHNATHSSPLFTETPNWSDPPADLSTLPPTPTSIKLNYYPNGNVDVAHSSWQGIVPNRTYLSGKCTIPIPSGGWPAKTHTSSNPLGENAVFGAHVWLANLLYSEQIAWPLDTFVSDLWDLNPDDGTSRDYYFSIPLFSMMESLSHFMSSGVPVCGAGTGATCPSLKKDPAFRFLESDNVAIEQREMWYFYWASTSAVSNGLQPIMMQGSASPYAGFTKHSWASFSAGQFVVMCNSYTTASGTMVPSPYQTHVDLSTIIDPVTHALTNKIEAANLKRAGISGTHWRDVSDKNTMRIM